jgi:hypothetical protein
MQVLDQNVISVSARIDYADIAPPLSLKLSLPQTLSPSLPFLFLSFPLYLPLTRSFTPRPPPLYHPPHPPPPTPHTPTFSLYGCSRLHIAFKMMPNA